MTTAMSGREGQNEHAAARSLGEGQNEHVVNVCFRADCGPGCQIESYGCFLQRVGMQIVHLHMPENHYT